MYLRVFSCPQHTFQRLFLRSTSVRILAGLACLVALLSCESEIDQTVNKSASLSPVSTEQRRLEQFFAATWREDLIRSPASASYLGVTDYQDKWNNVSETFQLESIDIARKRLTFIEGIDTTQLSQERLLSYQLYRLDLERTLAGAPYRHHQYVIHQYRGPHTSVVSLLINVHTINSEADALAYVARLNNLPDYFEGVIEQIQIRAEKGMFLVDWMVPKIIEAASNVTTGEPFDNSGVSSVIWHDFNAKLDQLPLASDVAMRLRQSARDALLNAVAPAYRSLILAIRVQAEQALSADGVWRFPDGEGFYRNRLSVFTTTDLTAEEIHQTGLANVERLHNEMRTVMAELNAQGDLVDFLDRVRRDTTLRYENNDAGRDAYLLAARQAIDAMAARLPAYFGMLPKSDLMVKRVEPYRERSAGKAFYQAHLRMDLAPAFITQTSTI